MNTISCRRQSVYFSCAILVGLSIHSLLPIQIQDTQLGVPYDADSVSLDDDVTSFTYGKHPAYQAVQRGIVADNPMIGDVPAKQAGPTRTRYAATELGIREKLFIGILSTVDSIETSGIAMNKTMGHFVEKLVFFMSGGSQVPAGLNVKLFTNEQRQQLPFHILKYIEEHYARTYDWYFFATDSTYVRAERLNEMVNRMSIIYEVYMGSPRGNVCPLEGGILLSQVHVARVVLMPCQKLFLTWQQSKTW